MVGGYFQEGGTEGEETVPLAAYRKKRKLCVALHLPSLCFLSGHEADSIPLPDSIPKLILSRIRGPIPKNMTPSSAIPCIWSQQQNSKQSSYLFCSSSHELLSKDRNPFWETLPQPGDHFRMNL